MNTRNWRVTFGSIAIALAFLVFSAVTWAYSDYDGCKGCHGGFENNNYVSKQDGAPWNRSLMDGHESMVGNSCNSCHKSGGRGQVYLNFSSDTSLSKSCVGCHGRQEDVNGSCVGGDGMQVECGAGAGLRRVHDSSLGAGTCNSCHSNDPTPAGEDINPYYYGRGGVVIKNACDADGTESRYGTTGLDNDGDGSVDSSDSDCQASNSPPTQPGSLSASVVTTSSATVSWGASTDADNDAITYRVVYRRNGTTPWNAAGTTGTTSLALNGLLDDQSYDVQVTANDGTEDSSARTATSLFKTEMVVQASCLDMGALAYDNWTMVDAGGSGALPSGETVSDYVRCKACHGWDHMGIDGGYARRSRNAGRPNAGLGDGDQRSRNISMAQRQSANVTADMIRHSGTGRFFSEGSGSWVEMDSMHSSGNMAAHSRGYTLGNQHPDFSGGELSQQQVDCLVEFLNAPEADPGAYFDSIYPASDPVTYVIKADADTVSGEAFYDANCFACHGDPATDHQGTNNGKPAGGILAYLAGDGKYSEFAHKARWGIPGTTMTREMMGSPEAIDVADTMLYLQQLGGTGLAINPGLSGHWWGGETRAGEGFLIDIANDDGGNLVMVVSFYTYDTMGNQVWLIGSGPVNGNTVEMSLVMPQGAMWGALFNPADRIEIDWGTGTFTFGSCGTGSVNLMPNAQMQNDGFTDLAYAVTRDLLVPGIACPTPAAVIAE